MNHGSRSGHVFLSYSHDDAEFALKLAADLKNSGVPIWMDRMDGIGTGAIWRRAIEQGINECSAMCAVVSPIYVNSAYCIKELDRADTLTRPILPVLVASVDPQVWPLSIEGIQYADFRDWRDDRSYSESYENLLACIAGNPDLNVSAPLGAEALYLNKLIADLEAKRGILQYVSLAIEAEMRPEPPADDEWGFAELVGDDHRNVVPLDNVAQAVSRHPRFILLGTPGSGKTTTIRRLALEEARRRMSGIAEAPIPLLISLSEWAGEQTLTDFLHSNWHQPSSLERGLASGEVTLYLDGLNEMGSGVLTRPGTCVNGSWDPKALHVL